jgi:hypothetical protein
LQAEEVYEEGCCGLEISYVRWVHGGAWGCLGVHMRKKRNVKSVMGWLLSFQLSDPGAGVCWADSMACGVWCWSGGAAFHVASGGAARRERDMAGESAVGELWFDAELPRTS